MTRRLVVRDRNVATRISTTELYRWHATAQRAGLTLSELLREAVRHYSRQLADDVRDSASEMAGHP
jgi:hypothetical protein